MDLVYLSGKLHRYDAGAIPILIQLLKNKDVALQEQASWALGNIAGDGDYYRNMVIHAGVLKPLLNTLLINSEGVTAKVKP
ncbi:hypothetical protein SK128_001774 [Halocaridina rubra]|uniref:Uncharacterized protein n=1 Tax=Halocaridina rubra TaxID=373956 RepID=A0AAN8WJF5_HALRR